LSSTHFGNPMIEQRELLAGAALVRDEVGVIEVAGEPRLGWLHALLTQNLANLKPGDSAETLLLDPNGHIEQHIRVINQAEQSLLLVPVTQAEGLEVWLRKMVFRTAVTITNRTGEFEQLIGFADQPELAEHPVWVDPWPGVVAGGARYSNLQPSYGARHWLVPVGFEHGKNDAGTLALTALRVAVGRPEFEDFDDKTLPHEFDLLSTAVHLSKGCYRGQETVAKVHNMGRPPRRLVLLHLETGEAVPDAGAAVRVPETEAECGSIRAGALHFEAGAIALALVTRRTDESTELEVELDGAWVRASQEVLVPAEAGRAAPPPKLPRLKLSGPRP